MSVYFIASYDIDDTDAHNDYIATADSLLGKYGGTVLVDDQDAKVIEGESWMINVIVQLESEASAMGCYNDSEYRLIKQMRLNTAKNRSLVLAKEFIDESVL